MRAIIPCYFVICSLYAFAAVAKPTDVNIQKVIQKLWQQRAHEFDTTFKDIAARYAAQHPERSNAQICGTLVHHCRTLHNFIKCIWVDAKNDCLAYGDAAAVSLEFTPMIMRWKTNQFFSFYQFYIIYFDAISHLFIHAINDAYIHRRADLYTEYVSWAQAYHNEMIMIHKMLLDTEYEERYAYQLNRYYDLLHFLQAGKDVL